MLDQLLSRRELHALRTRILSGPNQDRRIVSAAEASVALDPESAFELGDGGSAVLALGDRRYSAGRFRTLSLAELRIMARARPPAEPSRLSILLGADPLTDIGALQAMDDGNSLFQVASQFNCLEAPGPRVTAVANYLYDPTQGPRASIGAWPATLLRHYRAPDGQGGHFVQSDSAQLNLLHAACKPGVGRVQSGYLNASTIQDPGAFSQSLAQHFEDLQVGLHEAAQVVFGANWDGWVPQPAPHIAQVFTSTLAAGGYGEPVMPGSIWEDIARTVLRVAYLGTLLAARALGMKRAVLTLIGGGVFGNPHALIFEQILWAADQVPGLHVVVNGRELRLPATQVQQVVAQRGGVVVRLN
jgi:hypothetical protein